MVTNWIPVSERLPEEKGLYFVTTDGRYNNIVEVTFYNHTNNIWYIASEVIAWMPLPVPYEKDNGGMK